MSALAGLAGRARRQESQQLKLGYTFGNMGAAVVLLFAVNLARTRLNTFKPQTLEMIFIGFMICFGLLDFIGRTPKWNRQTPATLRQLSAFPRGLTWGFDIGLMFTTVRTTSLTWVILLGAVLLPSANIGILTLAAFVTTTVGLYLWNARIWTQRSSKLTELHAASSVPARNLHRLSALAIFLAAITLMATQ